MSNTKKLISFALILLLLGAVVLFASALIRQSRLSDSGREFAIEVVPLLLSGNPRYEAEEDDEAVTERIEPPSLAETIERLAHPHLLEQQSTDDLEKYLRVVTLNLGRLEVVRNIRGSSDVPLLNFTASAPSAAYQLEAEFVAGVAEVNLTLLYEQGSWWIDTLSVESTLLSD